MIDISGHLRDYRLEIGFENHTVPLEVNCCGQQKFLTKDFTKVRLSGRLDYQIIYVAHGSGIFTAGGIQQRVPAGNIVLYRPHDPQIYSYSYKDKTCAYWIHFTGNDIEGLLDRFNIHSGYIGDSIQIKNTFQEAILELQLRKTGYKEIANACFLKLLALIQRFSQTESSDLKSDFNLERLIIRLNQSYNQPWTVPDMARFCNVSEGYFSHSFKEKTGQAPIKYLINLRMEKAKFLLSESDMSISTIASSIGYADELYFSRLFKNTTGESPSSYRRNLT
ncbi:helix-turn-helix transcriptional regulator [Butyrivibrio sp. MC2013]|uniref:helix-turn-helix transcriptional regulator n=1 Tax=Butyrivibrio sp. MC2013 TaxID=1280686 RepID=UPI0003FF9AEF|nr:AraC family transcriptional regulator [Butyrivibrio sp. MC2013]